MGKQHVHLHVETMTPYKTLENILKYINTQVLESKYVINLGQLLRIMPNIKQYIFKLVKFVQLVQFEPIYPKPTCAAITIDHKAMLFMFKLVRTLLMM
jgi:hypothetical protein